MVTSATRSVARSIALFAIGGATYLIMLSIGTSYMELGLRPVVSVRETITTIAYLLPLGYAALAAGNRARKYNPAHLAPRVLTSVAGGVIILSFLIPTIPVSRRAAATS